MLVEKKSTAELVIELLEARHYHISCAESCTGGLLTAGLVDVPNASMMVIFDANRFGLSTLHQLRGRVGRGNIASKCILISNTDTKRLEIMERTNDGFEISEEDFKLRGHGDLFGTKQSGDMSFKIASIRQDYKILIQAKKDSLEYLQDKSTDQDELKIQLIESINRNS